MGEGELPETLSPVEAREVIATEHPDVVDLRSEDEFAESHIAGARRADDVEDVVGELEEGATVVVVCDEGERSAEAAAELRDRGFRAASIDGGMSAWDSKSLPVQPGIDEEFEGPSRTIIQ